MGLLVNRACLCGCVSALLLTNARGACADPDHFALSNTSAYSSLDILRASAPREQATTTNGSGKAELDRTTSISEIILRESLTRGVFLYETIDPPSSLLTGPSRGDTRPASQPWIGENGADDESFTSALTYRTALSRAISDRPFDSRLGKRFNVMPGLGFEVGLDTLGTSTIDDEVGIYAPYHSIAHLRGGASSVKIVDASVGWDAISTNAFRLSLLGGVRGIGFGTDDRAPLPGQPNGSFETVPVIGGQMQVNVDSDVFLRGRAMGNFGSDGAEYLDIGAEFGVGLTTWADIVAGYKLFHANVTEANAELDDRSFYASLRLQY
ncbi:MAG: hypothetical protein H6815_06270 [Phycisphaeraceae bacterium]|nr:hypothetical protein [Phycisphaerales bacterium]MCB9860044.1 hypothetical protein [Phycisphaeraceae bacterium]